jgi:hypothetical protein
MRNYSVSRFILVIVLSCTLSFIKAQSDKLNVVTTAVPFLRISPDARAGGMGDVGIATAPDVNSPFWNLAKTPFTKNRSAVGFNYTPWLKDLGVNDVYLLCASGYHKVDELNAISGSIRYFSLGNIQFTDYSGNSIGSSNPREYGIDFGYSRKLGDKLGLGVSLRYINSSLANGASTGGTVYKAGTSVAGDISLFKNAPNENGEGFSWGINLSNLGAKIGYTNDAQNKDYIPANMGLGLAYTTVPDESNKITFALDINKLLVPSAPVASDPTDASLDSLNLADYRNKSVVNSWFGSFSGGSQFQKLQFSAGVEYMYNDQFALRAGYFYEDVSQGNRKYFTFGAGLKYNVIGINISYLAPSGSGVTKNPLSNTLRFGLTFDLDGGGGSESTPSSLDNN